jgi:hypothetical protein
MIIPGQFRQHEYIPTQLVTPNYELLAQSLDNMQQEYDLAGEVLSKRPDYIRESDVDVAGYKGFVNRADDLQQSIADAYMSGDINKGRIAQRDAMREIKNLLTMPGQEGYELMRRSKEFQAYKTNTLKRYENDPDLAQYAIRNVNYGDSLQSSISGPTMYNRISGEELNTLMSGYIKNIAKTLLSKQDYKKYLLDNHGITTLHEFVNYTGVDYNRALRILADKVGTNKELLNSLMQDERVNRYFAGDDSVVDPNDFLQPFVPEVKSDGTVVAKTDENGRMITRNNTIGRLLKTYAMSAEHADPKFDRIKDQNEWLEEDMKFQYRKRLKDYENSMSDFMFTTQSDGNEITYNSDYYSSNIKGLDKRLHQLTENLRKNPDDKGTMVEYQKVQTERKSSLKTVDEMLKSQGSSLSDEIDSMIENEFFGKNSDVMKGVRRSLKNIEKYGKNEDPNSYHNEDPWIGIINQNTKEVIFKVPVVNGNVNFDKESGWYKELKQLIVEGNNLGVTSWNRREKNDYKQDMYSPSVPNYRSTDITTERLLDKIENKKINIWYK